MNRKPVIFLFFLFLVLQLAAGCLLLSGGKEDTLDTVEVNEAVQSAVMQWESLQAGKGMELPPSVSLDYTVLDAQGKPLAASRNGLSATVNEAVAHRDTILDITIEGEPVGKLLIDNQSGSRRKERSWILFTVLVCSALLELLLLAGYLVYLNRFVFRPFRRLKTFAVRVAGGELDFPLEMDRENAFGAFTESFDLMREELKKARSKEQAANKSKKELVAKLSHDIKTPVASIKAVSELMAVSARTDKEQKQLAVIRDKADQIDLLISDLFHATLEELQELPVLPAEQSSHLLSELIAAADYQERADVSPVPDCILVFDRVRLQQVFDNLFSNSYKYAGSSIRVSFSLTDESLTVSIRDFGPGVPGEELPLLMEKYYRGTNAQAKSGAGLGLFISRYLLSQMGGTLACQNEADGFCAAVTLRLAGALPN